MSGAALSWGLQIGIKLLRLSEFDQEQEIMDDEGDVCGEICCEGAMTISMIIVDCAGWYCENLCPKCAALKRGRARSDSSKRGDSFERREPFRYRFGAR
jgi:hypothetical protein